MDKINIVMTGGTSGFGRITAKILIENPNVKLILGYRNKQIKGAFHIPLNLQVLDEVQSFAKQIIQKIDHEKIDVLICNAGTNFSTVNNRTTDGFETTFAVNHLAHYLLIRLLMSHFSKNVKIILTTSGTHNPAKKTKLAFPEHAEVFWLANPEKDSTSDKNVLVNAQRAYSSSKLCNLLTARYINTISQSRQNNWQGIAFDPGPTPGTGLTQNLGLMMRFLWQILAIPIMRKWMLPKSNSRKQAGKALADIALGNLQIPAGKEYAALRQGIMTFPNPSELAQKDEIMKKVWFESEKILNLKKY